MKIVVLDSLSVGEDMDLSSFGEFGKLEIYRTSTLEEARQRLSSSDVEVVLSNKVLLNEYTMKNATNLKLICVTATGYNNVDLDYARSRGITVTNVAGYSTHSVAQHTFAMLFYLMEKLNYYDKFVKNGDYVGYPMFCNVSNVFHEIHGMTWGIIGLGAIGREVAQIARAFGCNVIYYSTSGRNANPDYERVELDELLSRSDIVSIHSPLNDATNNLMNKETFAKMKNTAILINVGRGPIVNEADLIYALNNGQIQAAGLDVLCTEPMEKGNPLLEIQDSERLLITPHMAWGTYEARKRLLDEVHKNIECFYEGKKRNVIV